MDWTTLVPTLVGAGISVTTTVVMFAVAYKFQQRNELDRREDRSARLAYSGLQKLMRTANGVLVLAKHFDTEFEEAHKHAKRGDDPALWVREFVGARPIFSEVTEEETAFLSDNEGFDLLSRIWTMQNRAINNEHIAEKFNDLKREFSSFIEERVGGVYDIKGSVAALNLQDDDASAAILRIGKMNSVIGQLVSHLEEDRVEMKAVVDDYARLASLRFQDRFPMNKIEWKF